MTKEELFQNVDFMDEVLDLGMAEEVQKKFADKGVEISIDEVEEIGSIFNEAISNINSSELSDDALETVAGGLAGGLASGLDDKRLIDILSIEKIENSPINRLINDETDRFLQMIRNRQTDRGRIIPIGFAENNNNKNLA